MPRSPLVPNRHPEPNPEGIARAVRGLDRLVADPLAWYWRDGAYQDYVGARFSRAYGSGPTARDETGKPLPVEPILTEIEPYRPQARLEDAAPAQPVGPGGANRPGDVLGLQKVLSGVGRYVFDIAGGERAGVYSDALHSAIEGFQAETGATVDGVVAPGGETAPLLRRARWPEGGPMTPRVARPQAGPPIVANLASGALSRLVDSADKKGEKERGETIQAELERAEAMPPVAPPTFDMAENRIRIIKDGGEARFTIEDNPDADDSPRYWRSESAGRSAVQLHDPIVRRVARQIRIDPDLVRAVMYVEAADGHYFGLGKVGEGLGWARTIEPMNVHSEAWDGMIGVPGSRFGEPDANVKVGAEILKRIKERLDEKDRTVEKIATIYNSTGRERVSDYGARVARAYRERTWEDDG